MLPLERTWPDRLPSCHPDIEFDARVHLTAHPTPATRHRRPRHPGPSERDDDQLIGGCAVWAREQAAAITAQWSVLHRHGAQHALNAHLGAATPVQVAGTTLVAVTVALDVGAGAHAAALAVQAAHRDAHLDNLERRRIAATMHFLREQCLRDPATARLFLMLTPSPRLGIFPSPDNADEVIDQLSSWDPSMLWVQLAKTLQPVLSGLSPTQSAELLRLIGYGVERTGHPHAAQRIEQLRDNLDAADSTATPAAAQPANGAATPPR